tara:strand:+ start:148 stop:522 length:375 start_codon:yes stop_codon:yes gene_type:complete
MSILSEQLVISQLAFTNDITPNRLSRSLTAPSGYYGNNGQYPDPRTQMTGAGIVATGNESKTFEKIRNSFTAGELGGFTANGAKTVRGSRNFNTWAENAGNPHNSDETVLVQEDPSVWANLRWD